MEQLIQIYNTLLMVSTKGEDTMVMSDCLRALKAYIEQGIREQQEKESKLEEE